MYGCTPYGTYDSCVDKFYRCPYAFPNSQESAKSSEECYALVNGTKIYYKIIPSCDAGTYLPKKSYACAACPSDKKCPGLTNKRVSLNSDQGVQDCPAGQHPNEKHTACVASDTKKMCCW